MENVHRSTDYRSDHRGLVNKQLGKVNVVSGGDGDGGMQVNANTSSSVDWSWRFL